MKIWKQVGIFLMIWLGIDAILSSFIGWIAGLIGITCAVLIVMKMRKKYPNVEKQVRKREIRQGNENVREIKNRYIAENGKEAWRKYGKADLKSIIKEDVKWRMRNIKIQQEDAKDAEKERIRALRENSKAQARDERKYLTYAQKLKLNSMTYTADPNEIRKIAEEWIAENKRKEEAGRRRK